MAENRILAAVAVRPASFNGLHTEKAQAWWANFRRYVEFSGIEGANRGKLLGLLLSGTAQLWFDSLPEETQDDYERLEAAFRGKYVVPGPDNLQHQMQALTRQQSAGETVDEYIADARAKMANFNYNNDLQMTLVLNGLRPDVKAIVMQHLPFATMDALANKAKHVEAALKSYIQTSTHLSPIAAPEKSEVQKAIETLTSKVASIAHQVSDSLVNPHSGSRGNNRQSQPQVYYQDVKRCFICGNENY